MQKTCLRCHQDKNYDQFQPHRKICIPCRTEQRKIGLAKRKERKEEPAKPPKPKKVYIKGGKNDTQNKQTFCTTPLCNAWLYGKHTTMQEAPQ